MRFPYFEKSVEGNRLSTCLATVIEERTMDQFPTIMTFTRLCKLLLGKYILKALYHVDGYVCTRLSVVCPYVYTMISAPILNEELRNLTGKMLFLIQPDRSTVKRVIKI